MGFELTDLGPKIEKSLNFPRLLFLDAADGFGGFFIERFKVARFSV